MEKVTAEIAISKVEFYYLVNKLENVVKIYTYCSINFVMFHFGQRKFRQVQINLKHSAHTLNMDASSSSIHFYKFWDLCKDDKKN